MLISHQHLIVFGCVLIRLLFMFIYTPGLNIKEFFGLGKLSFAVWLSLLTVFVIPVPTELPLEGIVIILTLLKEALIGMMIGFIMDLFIIGIEFGGSLSDTQAGLSVANILDPSSGQNVTLISKIFRYLGILLFFILEGHHTLLTAVVKSFEIIPIATSINHSDAIIHIIESSIRIFSVALQVAAPIILVIFFVDFGFGLLSRIAPQVNIFQLSFQMKPLITMFILLNIVPGMIDILNYVLDDTTRLLIDLLSIMRS